MCQFPRATDFDQITSDSIAQKHLKDLYGSVDNIEFYVGLYAEDVRPGSALGPLVGRLIGIDAFSQVLTNPLLANNIFNPDTFSPVGWEIIHETNSLEDIVHRNIPHNGIRRQSSRSIASSLRLTVLICSSPFLITAVYHSFMMKLFTEYPEKEEQKYSDKVAKAAKINMDALYKDATRALRDTHAKTPRLRARNVRDFCF